MAFLDRDLLGDELLLEQHRADADREDRQPERQAIERGGDRVGPLTGGAHRLVLPRPEQEDQQQRQARNAAEEKPIRDRTLGSLLGFRAGYRPAVFLEDSVDAVEFAAQLNELLTGHRGQFGVAGLCRRA